LACRTPASFGFTFPCATAVNANQHHAAVCVFMCIEHNGMSMPHGLLPDCAADTLDGFTPQLNPVVLQDLSCNFK
jgi:hypothetical protein